MDNGELDLGRPSWMPPDDVLPAIVPTGQFLIRAEQIIIALSHLSVYPNGCMLHVRACARGPAVASDVFERMAFFERMVFKAQFGAEITAVMDDEEPWRRRSRGEPALVLMQHGREGNSGESSAGDRRVDSTLLLWLDPLPPPELGTLSIIAPNLGPGPARCPLDGRAIVAASAGVQPYWR